RRKVSENVRYKPVATDRFTISTAERRDESVSASELHADKTLFVTPDTRLTLNEEEAEVFDKVAEPASGYKVFPTTNPFDFKVPLNCVIADHDPEKRFIAGLLQSQNRTAYDAWIKSVPTRFYEIDYAWKKGEHPKRGKFSPDFFIKAGHTIIVVETKDDFELKEPSEENKKKAEYATAHFDRLNQILESESSARRYKFVFLTPKGYAAFFDSLRAGKIMSYRSELDIRLSENGD